jgi:mRNA-decapping enzyme subunit 2
MQLTKKCLKIYQGLLHLDHFWNDLIFSFSRFILNLPDHELSTLERVSFQVEQACVLPYLCSLLNLAFYLSHWFYEDFIREENPKFPSLPLKRFSAMLFEACPVLYQWSHDHEQAFNKFLQYKTRVPVCGAIMLNDAMDKVFPVFYCVCCN